MVKRKKVFHDAHDQVDDIAKASVAALELSHHDTAITT